MSALLLLSVLAQVPQETSEKPWRTQRADGSTCIRVTKEDGTEEEQCRPAGSSVYRAVPADGPGGPPVAPPEPTAAERRPDPDDAVIAPRPLARCPADAQPSWSDSPRAVQAQMLRDCGMTATTPTSSRFGVAVIAGPELSEDGVRPPGFHLRVGARYALLPRKDERFAANVAVALLGGGGVSARGWSAGLDARLEALALGPESKLLEPFLIAYLMLGIAREMTSSGAIELHLGVGVGADMLFSGLMGPNPMSGDWLNPLPMMIALMLPAFSPTAELRYTVRADGQNFASVVVGLGI